MNTVTTNQPQPRPRAVPPPRGRSGVTAAWLSEALGPGILNGATVRAVTARRVGEGRGHLGMSIRVELDYSTTVPDAPRSVVVKLPAETQESVDTARRGRLYEREFRFFTDLAPRTDVRAPRCFAAAYDRTTDDCALVLEDVTGRVEVDQLDGCPLPQAEQVLQQLGRLHASWWQNPDLPRQRWLTTFTSEHRLANLHRLLVAGWPRLCAHFGDRLPAGAAEIGATVADEFVSTMRRFDEHPQTLLHGDARLDNFMFDAGVARAPVVLLDWQNVGRGPAIADIGYFVAQNLTPTAIREHAEELLASYHAELVRHGVTNFSRRQLTDSLWQALPVSFAVAASLFVLGDTTLPRTRELAAVMAERALAAADTLGLLERISQSAST
jgi:aminoglycoside phosphotransferase (APT) family kinase protein